MEKFHYNPIPLTERTREYFPNLQTLYQYYSNDNQFETDTRIIARKHCKIKEYDLYHDQIQLLEEWSGLSIGNIVFDSKIDNKDRSRWNFYPKILNKKQLLFLIESTDGEKFGYYEDKLIKREHRLIQIKPTNEKSFHFNIQSRNNRLSNPMKFEIKEPYSHGYGFVWCPKPTTLIRIGTIIIKNKRFKNNSYCLPQNDSFDFHGIERALCGNEPNEKGNMIFSPKRMLVIQMKSQI